MKAVLDTVVFVRALINPGGLWGRLLFQYSDRYDLVLSPEIIREILEVTSRSTLRKRFPAIGGMRVERMLDVIERAEVVEPPAGVDVCRDPADNKFFDCALAAGADFIVSEDKDILVVGQLGHLRTVPAADFLALLDAV